MERPPLIDDDMITRRFCVRPRDVVFVKDVLEASVGLATLFAAAGGDLTIAASVSREAELDEVLRDLCAELEGAALSEMGAEPTVGD